MATKAYSRSGITINKTTPGMTKEYEMKQSFSAAQSSGNGYVHNTINDAVSGREKEKREMQDLNERLANYIEKVLFLEAQNKRLANEVNSIRDRWGKETEKIKSMYEVEMEQLKKLLDEAEAARHDLTPKVNKLEEQFQEYTLGIDEANNQHGFDREMIEKLSRQLSEYEGEIGLLRRRIAFLEEERQRNKKLLGRLRDEAKRTKMDVDQESMNHMALAAELLSLKDEIEFMKEIHDNEMKDLATLAYRDTTAENRDFWRTEMGTSLRQLQTEYDGKLEEMKNDCENHHSVKIQEIRHSTPREAMEAVHLKEESSRLKTQMSNLRSRCPEIESKNAQLEMYLEELRKDFDHQTADFEMEKNKLKGELQKSQDELDAIMKEFQMVMDMKLSLELEIAAYRKLLEGEENRCGLRSMMEQTIFKSGGLQESMISKVTASSSQMKAERKSNVSHQRTAKGSVIIHEACVDGKHIILENTGKKDEDISGFKIFRNIDNERSVVQYELPNSTILKPTGESRFIKIWSKGNRPAGSNDLECQSSTWGTGVQVITVLFNKTNEERATLAQTTSFKS